VPIHGAAESSFRSWWKCLFGHCSKSWPAKNIDTKLERLTVSYRVIGLHLKGLICAVYNYWYYQAIQKRIQYCQTPVILYQLPYPPPFHQACLFMCMHFLLCFLVPKVSHISCIFVYYCNCNATHHWNLNSMSALSLTRVAKFYSLWDYKPSTGCTLPICLQLIQNLTRIKFYIWQ
jgi:hypothetical protein